MDVTTFMQSLLADQARQTSLLESINEGIQTLVERAPVFTELKAGELLDQAIGHVEQALEIVKGAEKDEPAKQEPVVEKTEAPKTVQAEKPKDDAKPATADDVRTQLQGYAKKHGNPSAMEMLEAFSAKSVTSLMELGEEKVKAFLEALAEGMK
jgi:hypothetical protein